MFLRCTCTTITGGHVARSQSCPLHSMTSNLTRKYDDDFSDAALRVGDTIIMKVPTRATQHEEYSGYDLTPDGFVPKKDL